MIQKINLRYYVLDYSKLSYYTISKLSVNKTVVFKLSRLCFHFILKLAELPGDKALLAMRTQYHIFAHGYFILNFLPFRTSINDDDDDDDDDGEPAGSRRYPPGVAVERTIVATRASMKPIHNRITCWMETGVRNTVQRR
jgi:hypothetical protein